MSTHDPHSHPVPLGVSASLLCRCAGEIGFDRFIRGNLHILMPNTAKTSELDAILEDEADRQNFLTAGLLQLSFGNYPWYDAGVRYKIAFAQHYLNKVRPDKVAEFSAALAHFETPSTFQTVSISDFLNRHEFAELQRHNARLRNETNGVDENRLCGRRRFNNYPIFSNFHQRLAGWVTENVGEKVVPSFSLLAQYGPEGKLPLHIDSQDSMWTLGVCIERNVDWPIFISNVVQKVPEPTLEEWKHEQVRADPRLIFRSFSLAPNQAIFYSASSQWHYRNAIPDSLKGFFDIIFFQFVPAHSEVCIKSELWGSYFDCRELAVLHSFFQWKSRLSKAAV